MTPRDAIGELERMGYEFTLLSGAVVHYRMSPAASSAPAMGAPTVNLDDADRNRAEKLLAYLAANKSGMISVLERRDISTPGDVVKVELIGEYLAQHGYRVVRATWPEREPRPLLIVAEAACPQ